MAGLIQVGPFGDGCACFYTIGEITHEDTVHIVAIKVETALELEACTGEARGVV